jgi:hypothetical protein
MRLAFFGLGTALFVWLVAQIGVRQLRADALATGWMIVPIVLLYGLVHGCSAGALQLVLHDERGRPGLARTWAIVVAGTAINFITPIVNAGGEPYKVAELGPALGAARAAGAVILHAILRLLGFLLVWLTALILGLLLLRRTPMTLALLAGGIVVVGALIALLVGGHRRRPLERTLDLVHRVPGLRRLAGRLDARRPAIVATDAQIAEFHRRHPRRFALAVALEYAGRCLFMLEFCLIGLSIGTRVRYLDAFVVGGLEALVTNLLFFVPFELGTRESATYVLFQQLGYGGGIGLYAALVSRLRDLVWIGAGLVLIWAGQRRRPAARPAEGSTPA